VRPRLQTRVQRLERSCPRVSPEDPEMIRMRLALQTLSTETLDQLGPVLQAEAAGRPLTDAELETARVFKVALAAVPVFTPM
jgi:hypothetical protein